MPRRKLSCQLLPRGADADAEYQAPLPAGFPDQDKTQGRRFTHFLACFQGSAVSVATFMGGVLGLLCVSSAVLLWRRQSLASRRSGM